MITSFSAVFESKLEKLIKRIKKEVELPKEKRNKTALKKMVKEAKELRKLIRQFNSNREKVCCPNCECHFIP
jgi:hypothetical protein